MNRKDLTYRCEVCESSCRSRGLATDAELAAIRPGGTENDSRGMDGTVRWFGYLCGFLARRDASEIQREAADSQAAAALLERPTTVTMPGLKPEDPPREFTVHPKGFEALADA